MTTFWAVAEQFEESSGWWLVGGVEGRHQLHMALEGPNPDPRQPPEPDLRLPPPHLRYGTGTLTLDRDRPLPAAEAPHPRYPLYILVLGLPDGERLRADGGGTGYSRHMRGGVYRPSHMDARYAIPEPVVTELTAALYDGDELLATGLLIRRTP